MEHRGTGAGWGGVGMVVMGRWRWRKGGGGFDGCPFVERSWDGVTEAFLFYFIFLIAVCWYLIQFGLDSVRVCKEGWTGEQSFVLTVK